MGATQFTQIGKGATAREAFGQAVEKAAYDYGHGRYTGSMAEKQSFIEIPVPAGEDPVKFAMGLLNPNSGGHSDVRIDDKWGPAGCVKTQDGEYLFFGWASS